MFKSKDLEEIVLIDFGLSNFYKKNEMAQIFGMTPAYCSPEITQGNSMSLISTKADIFSFGMYIQIIKINNFFRILYEIATEKHAFLNLRLNADKIYNFIRSKDFDFFNQNPKTGNKKLDEVISSCTHRDLN